MRRNTPQLFQLTDEHGWTIEAHASAARITEPRMVAACVCAAAVWVAKVKARTSLCGGSAVEPRCPRG